ncbi:ABC transporter permease [Lachnospiraceae bacterium 46-15]
MNIFLKLVIKGLKRRKKEMRYVSAVTFLSVLFISSVILFQNIMDNYLMETNYQNYGDWVLSSVEDFQETGVLFSELKHPYLAASGICQTGAELLDKQNEPSGVNLGTLDAAVRDFGNIALYEGRFPESPDEIAMDLSSLSTLGYSYELGQTIRAAVQDEKGIRETTFRLTGTIKSFAENWKHLSRYPLPNGIVTEKGLKKTGEPLFTTHFYHLDRLYENLDTEEFASAFLKRNQPMVYNSYTYENRVWGAQDMFHTAEFVLLLTGTLSIGYLMMSYVSQRRKWYYRLRCTGADKLQIRIMILTEAMYGTLPYALAAMALPYLAGAAICYAVSSGFRLPYFFEFRPADFLLQLGTVLGAILFAVLCAWLASRDKQLERNRAEITKRQIKRLRRDSRTAKNTARIFLHRQRKLHPFQRAASILFSAVTCLILILCLNKIYQASQKYRELANNASDFHASYRKTLIEWVEHSNGNYGENSGASYYMYDGISAQTEEELRSLIGIHRIDRQIWDETHSLQWKHKNDNHVLSPLFHYHDADSSTLQKLKKDYDLPELDEAAFRNGEQIILLVFGFEDSLTDEDPLKSPPHIGDTVEISGRKSIFHIPEENTGHKPLESDFTQMKEYSLPGHIPVTIGAVIENPSFEWKALFGYSHAYGVIASRKLAARVAKADGQTLQNNRLLIDLNKNQSFESTQKRLASMFEKNNIEYTSYTEELQESWNSCIRQACIYGILFCTILFIFLLLELRFHQIQHQYRKQNYRLLKQLGMENGMFRHMLIKESLGQSLWILLSIPCSYAVMAGNFYLENKKIQNTSGMYIWSESLGDYTSDLYWVTLDHLYSYTNLSYTITFVLLLTLTLILIGWQSAGTHKKEEEPQ